MTRIAKLRYGTTDLDLDFGDGTWRITSWVPKASAAGEDVEETPSVLVETASDDAMATQIQLLDDLVLRVDRYRTNPAYETPVWLRAKRNDETGEYRAIVKRLSYTPLNPSLDCEAVQHQSSYQLNIVRGGYWEDPTGRVYPTPAAAAGASVEWDYTAADAGDGIAAHDIVGDVAARIAGFRVLNSTVGIDKLYAGVRSAGVRQIANWEGAWECELGSNTALSADDVASEVNTASPGVGGGAFVTGTPTGSNVWERYMSINLGQIYANPADFDAAFGTFLWLLRCKVGAASNTYQIQLRWGYLGMDDVDHVRGPIVEVSNTAWDYAEMGVQKITLRDYHVINSAALSQNFDERAQVQIWARRTSGASTIKFDCLCPIAVDEGYLIVRDAIEAGDIQLVYGESPDGRKGTFTMNVGAIITKYGTLDSMGFGFPPGDGRVDLVYTRAGSSVLTDTITVSILATSNYHERWRSLRGAE